MSLLRCVIALFCVAATALLASCGGGGGGDDDGPDTIAVTYDVASIDRNMLISNSNSIDLVVTLSSVPSERTFTVVLADQPGLFARTAVVVQTGPRTFQATLRLLDTMPTGVYTGTLSFRLCRDPACASEYRLSGTALPYSIHFWPRVKLDIVSRGVRVSADLISYRVVTGEQITLISNVPVNWGKGSSIGSDLVNVTTTPTQWTGQIVGTPGGFVSVTADSIAVGDGQTVGFDLLP